MQSPAVYWRELERFGDAPALIEPASGEIVSYGDLHAEIQDLSTLLDSHPRSLIVALCDTSIRGVVTLLSALNSHHAVFLLNAKTAEAEFSELVSRYLPGLVLGPARAMAQFSGERQLQVSSFREICLWDRGAVRAEVHPDLKLLLSTSGSLGSRKAVRLSQDNLAVSAWQIVQALDLSPKSRPLLTLPLAYTYGMSVLVSHLSCGAATVLESRSILRRAVWDQCAAASPSSIAGVAFTLEALMQMGFGRGSDSSISTITHSGDALKPEVLEWLKSLHPRIRTFLMYGMTEATSRIAVLDPEDFLVTGGGVGRAVAGARLEIRPDGEIVFYGPNVMMGYASDAKDLVRGDDLKGVLHTGDLGELDQFGCLRLVGRKSRLTKIMGVRLSLDDLERRAAAIAPNVVMAEGDQVRIHVEAPFLEAIGNYLDTMCVELRLPRHCFEVVAVDRLERLDSGKVSRAGTAELAAAERR